MSSFQFRADGAFAQASLAQRPSSYDPRFRERNSSEPDVNALELVSEVNSLPSTAISSRSPTPESPYGDHLVDVYLDRLGIRKPIFSRIIDLQGEQRRHINALPFDVLVPIVSYLDSTHDLLSFMLVQRRWHLLAASRIWFKPIILNESSLHKITACLDSKSGKVYHPLIHRLNLAPVAKFLEDEDLAPFLACPNIDRLVLSGCKGLSSGAIEDLLLHTPHVQSLDLQDVTQITDKTLSVISQSCTELQIFYGGGTLVSNAGLAHFAALKQNLRRLVLSHCELATASGLVELLAQCSQLMELDPTRMACFRGDSVNLALLTAQIEEGNTHSSVARAISSGLSDDDSRLLLANCTSLRDLRLDGSSALSARGFNLTGVRLITPRLEALRVLSLSMCTQLNDTAISHLVQIAPRVRHLNISKCPLITDKSVGLIAQTYNHGLHYLHLGHCIKITDCAIAFIVESCSRLTFFDAANCANLTDASLAFLAKLPRLRRIGVVKCNEIGAAGVMALSVRPEGVETSSPIERLHLSYCSSISIQSIKMVLDACPRLVHLSLTGVRAFMQTDIMQLSRPPPPELNEHQRQVFCVFSGTGISHLREALSGFLNADTRNFIGPRLANLLPELAGLPVQTEADPEPQVVASPPRETPPGAWTQQQPQARGRSELPRTENLHWRELHHNQREALEDSWRNQFAVWQGRAGTIPAWLEPRRFLGVARSQPTDSVFDIVQATPRRSEDYTPPNGPL